jgi:thiol-disulfide isomerase/thioredoxin
MKTQLYRWRILLVAVAAIAGAYVARADEAADDAEPESKHPFMVKFVDETGQPVVGALGGVTAYFGSEGSTLTAVDEAGWRYWQDATSDADGISRFPDGLQFDHLCLISRHTDRKLVAIEKIDPARFDPDKATSSIVMHPECRISGCLTSTDLATRNRALGWTNVYLNLAGNRALGCTSEKGEFHFFVPPGEFKVNPYGNHVHGMEKSVIVKPGQSELVLEAIDLPATRLALLQGMPAPELAGVVDWKNGSPVKLSDLNGKCVILDFWGYWCGPCVYRMPDLFKIYDKYHGAGLEVIGVHVDLGEDEKEPVDSVDKLDTRLAKIRKNVWNGRDLPYAVALITAKRIPFGPAGLTRDARCQASADYGVTGYPTMILINAAGKVVDRFEPTNDEHVDLLEKLLGVKR